MTKLLSELDPLTRERMATYAAWRCTPQNEREPRTMPELAAQLGVTSRTLRLWRYRPAFQELIAPLVEDGIRADLPEIGLALRRRAKEGSEPHIRLSLELLQAYGHKPRGSEPERAPIQIQVWAPSQPALPSEAAEVTELPPAHTVEETE